MYAQRVLRRGIIWLVSSVISISGMIVAGFVVSNMISGIPFEQQRQFYNLVICVGTPICIFIGQIINSVLIRTWDTWLDSLGPKQIAMLIPELELRKEELEGERKELQAMLAVPEVDERGVHRTT